MSVSCEICGTAVRTKYAAARLEIDGKTSYFCCEACRRTFHEHPDLFPLALRAVARMDATAALRAP